MDDFSSIVYRCDRFVDRLVELSGILGECKPESGSCTSVREQAKHLWPLRFVAFRIQPEVLIIEPGGEALDLPTQVRITSPAVPQVFKRGNPFSVQTNP